MGIWNLCVQTVLVCGLAQPPGTPPGGPPGSPPATGAPAAGQSAPTGQAETPLGLHVFGLFLFGAITTVLVYPTGRFES